MNIHLHVRDGFQTLIAFHVLLKLCHQGFDVLSDLAKIQVHVLQEGKRCGSAITTPSKITE